MVCSERLFDSESARNQIKIGTFLDKLWQKLKKNLRLKGALMRAIDFLAQTASRTHLRALF
jgi:hypothetical protein